MNLRAHSGKLAAWLAATAAAAITTLLLAWLGANSTTAGMVFLVLVVWSAAQAGRWLPFYLAILCALSFDYFFLPPYHNLWLEGPQAWVAILSFVASCVVVSRVAERARIETGQAEQRREDVERLYELSQQLMLYEDAGRLIRDLPLLIDRIFGLQGVVLYVCDQDQLYASTSELPVDMEADLRAMSQGSRSNLAIEAGYQAAPLMLGMRPLGALGWRPGLGGGLSRQVAAAVSAQVAIVLARAIAIAAFTRIEAARQGERLRTALIDSLTHELRTPLTSIRAAATTLIDGRGLNEAGRLDLAAIIDEEAARLDLLIGEAVEMAEIDAQVVAVHMVPLHPRALLDQAVEESERILAAHGVKISAAGPGELNESDKPDEPDEPAKPDEPAWFDPHLLSRVLRHLLENAAAHTPPGSRVTLSCKRDGDRLEFCVEDDGPGIDALDLPLIFEKFYRGQRGSATGRRKGSGMGLAITRAILAAHGGGIEASSIPGQGASFRFWVPLIEKEPSGKE